MDKTHDIVIKGGGLAGLSLAILCAMDGKKVLVIEKGNYPRHKVCGEYISKESLDFLSHLGVDAKALNLPEINHFYLSNSYHQQVDQKMKVGGIGISRYLLDDILYQKAKALGVEVLCDTKVIEQQKKEDIYHIKCNKQNTIYSQLFIDASGRKPAAPSKSKRPKFIGVKYHVDQGPDENCIEIHSFKGGYAGISKVEGDKYCLCYLINAKWVKQYHGDFKKLEKEHLSQNPFLAKRLEAETVMGPISTAKINFGVNSSTEINIGDASGFIPPLTGNGMSLAFRSAQQLHQQLQENNYLLTPNLEKKFQHYQKHYLKKRIQKGILLQHLLFKPQAFLLKNIFGLLKRSPQLFNFLIQQATGKNIPIPKKVIKS